jgi:hypothetical protein
VSKVEYKAITAAYRREFEEMLNKAAKEGWQMHSYRHHLVADPQSRHNAIEGWSAVMLRDLR